MNIDTCVILAAGKGTRFGGNVPKVMVKVGGFPLIEHVMDYWRPYVDNFVVVLGYKAKEIISILDEDVVCVMQNEQKGIAHALLQVEPLVKGNFVVALGDCLQSGTFKYPENLKNGCGVWSTGNLWDDMARSYAVFTQNERIYRVIEKPKLANEVESAYCGMGTYYFSPVVFDFIRKTPASKLRNEVEITDVLQKMIDGGEKVSPVFFEGDYINVTYPEDVKKAEAII